MDRQERKPFSSFDAVLGVGVLAVVAAGLPWLGQQLEMAKIARAQDQAGRVAQAILDYHAEMGLWPAASGQPVDLTLLTAVPPADHTLGAMGVPDARPWIEEVPVDSWGRPFQATVYDRGSAATPHTGTVRSYPMSPPPGTTIVVVSAGRDGILQSDPAALALDDTAFRGDDTGQVLRGRTGEAIDERQGALP